MGPVGWVSVGLEEGVMEFRLLGPLEVVDGDGAVRLAEGRQRGVLVLLLLHRNETVSSDRLIDALWGERPPATAAKVLQNHVGQLRRALGDREGVRLQTRGRGYAIRVESGELDIDRFEQLVREGSDALTHDDAAGAATRLREALALWRGPALADVAYESFAQPEIARLEERRLVALEQRIDADLALGRHADVIAELESLVAEHPLREQLRGPLMLALYRSGRQADALEVFQDARHALIEELGVEPGPSLRELQAAILRQDPALAPAPAAWPRLPRRSLRALVLLAVGGAALLAAAVGAALVERGADGPGGARVALGLADNSIAPDSVGVFDPGSNRIVDQVPIPGASLVAAHGRSVWVSNTSRTLSRVDGKKPSVTDVVPANATADDLVATKDAVWLLDLERRVLIKVNAAYGSVVKRVALRAQKRPAFQSGAGIDAGRGAVWVAAGTTRLLKLDQRDASVVKALDLRRTLDDVAVGTGAVWAISSSSASLLQLDPGSGSVRARIALVARPGLTRPVPVAVAAGVGAVWVLNHNVPSVSRIDPQLGAVTATIPLGVGSTPSAIATGAGAVWVALSGEGTVVRIDPNTGAVRSIPVGGAPTGVAVSQRRVWISVQPGFRAEPAARGRTIRVEGAISQHFCTPVEFAEHGLPRFLIVSDLPLQAPPTVAQSLQFSDAVRFVLARHDFRAGRHSVGYQSCDDSSAATVLGGTPATCRRNARAFVNAPAVLGVIGPFTSGCAAVELPILNAARGGPLAAISASATVVGLTHKGAGTLPGEPQSYYPRGVRSFARVVAADDVQGAAAALMARQLGVRRLYILNDQEAYGIAIAASVRKTARKLGIGIAGTEGYELRDHTFKNVAKRIERAGADGVFLGGLLAMSGPALVRDLRAALGPGVQILAPDGFPPEALIQQAGPAAEGVVVSVPVVDPARLPPTGRRFVEAFERAIEGKAAPTSAATAQATEVLLDAIAASNGTRASVTRNLLRTRVKNGILGSFEFDANGDTTTGGVTMYRIENGKARVLDVLTPPKSVR
jgi:DNA-binding SARP family transcriptional activator/ABC-type branched-subunit amino acid transport system substrate-binding protein/streptogramin lyase